MPDFKQNINSWSPQGNEWKKDDKEYKGKLEEYATIISDLLNKYGWLIGTLDIESTFLNGMMFEWIATYNTANPGAIALIRFLKEKKGDKYESSIASIAELDSFDAHKLLEQKEFFKNNCNNAKTRATFNIMTYDENDPDSSNSIEDIKNKILDNIDEKQKEKMELLLTQLLNVKYIGMGLNKKYSVILEALYRRFILKQENINMLFFDNDINYIENNYKGIINFLDTKLCDIEQQDFADEKPALDDKETTIKQFLTESGITITPICAASGHITFEETPGEDSNQSREQAVFLNDLAREVMKKQGLSTDEIDKKMLEAEKICFEEYVAREKGWRLNDKSEEIKAHITKLKQDIADLDERIKAEPKTAQPYQIKNDKLGPSAPRYDKLRPSKVPIFHNRLPPRSNPWQLNAVSKSPNNCQRYSANNKSKGFLIGTQPSY